MVSGRRRTIWISNWSTTTNRLWIYRRGDTKAKTWYLRIFDDKSKKPFVKSLQTQDHTKALTKARLIYQEVKGKIDRGERLHSITSQELVKKYLNSLHITEIPHEGVTPDSFRVKKYYLDNWLKFIDYLGHKNTGIDRLPVDKLRDFGKWFLAKPREDKRNKTRSHEQINNAISLSGCLLQKLLFVTVTLVKIKSLI